MRDKMKKKDVGLSFKLVRIEEKQFSVFEAGIHSEQINQKVGVGFNVDPKNNIIASAIHYLLEADDKPFINIEVVCYFELISKDYKKLLKPDNLVEIPIDFAQHLANITSGTTRGILFANTKDTPFNSYYMSLINLTEIIKEDVVLEAK